MDDVGKFRELQEERDRSYGKDIRTMIAARSNDQTERTTSPESRKRKRPSELENVHDDDAASNENSKNRKRKYTDNNALTGKRKKSRYKN